MHSISIPAGSTSQSVFIEVRSIANNVIAELLDETTLTGIYYDRSGADPATVSTVAITGGTDGAWVSGGLVEVGFGVYRVDIPNAALASGANFVVVTIADGSSSTEAYFGTVLIQLTNVTTDFSGAAVRRVAAR